MKILNFKSNILKIGVVIALVLILVPVIAAEEVDEAVSDSLDETVTVDAEEVSIEQTDDSGDDELEISGDSDIVISDENDEDLADEDTEEITNGEDVADVKGTGEFYDDEGSSADLQTTVLSDAKYAKVGDKVRFLLVAYNDGPDKATNVLVRHAFYSGGVMFLKAIPTKGVYDPLLATWYVGDLEPGEYQFLYLEGKVMTPEDVILLTYISSDTPDPIEENNYGFWFIDVEGEPSVAAEQTMHETANPIALAILALMSIAGVSLKRRF